MTRTSPTPAHTVSANRTTGNLFGVPLGNLGWFASLLIAVASGFMAFFAATFLAIVFILTANTAFHANIDFALSYRRVGLPVGLVVLVAALVYLGTLWCKRILRRN